ncbi:hypothetical protein IMG5_004580 [Ichthyophthirius multifiliis]|uniref:Cytoplasmic dynein 2 heavy chain 1 n=1 Tax=Ichthyophthirius multifiliis TaxID=5932 RepID=G0QJE3_ICHMU|nr:hypothetical protein IMG5_004580 [Ichthyophthirius multifiliis]EGR34655.1 hypothetical protein IMG5_004580 [Ichthyophthirius multifiliis]|eukprot:XP_004039959.1 hypothetical protein IMG5_004580 [Ichthyophthirius multifiliis]
MEIENRKYQKTLESGCLGKDQAKCKQWKINWDCQLYKALEHQYQRGFQLLDQNLEEINVDLVLQGKNIQLKPSLEEIKDKYYKEIKVFINWPVKEIQSFSGNSDIYQQMPKQNTDFIVLVYQKAYNLFTILQNELQQYNLWSQIAQFDIETIEDKIQSMEEWEINIKYIQQKRDEIENIEDNKQINCFNINMKPFKQNMDDCLQNLIDSIVNILKSSVKKDCDLIEDFISGSLERLTNKPKSMEEMNQARNSYIELKEKKTEMGDKINNIQSKNKILKKIVGFVYNIANTEKRWENFEVAIGDFDSILFEQSKQIRQDIGKKGDFLNQEIDKFYTRWQSVKPQKVEKFDKESARELGVKMKEMQSQWTDIEQRIDNLSKDAKHFEMNEFKFNNLLNVKNDLSSGVVFLYFININFQIKFKKDSQWALFDKFNSELENLEKEEWIVFKSRLYDFQDFLVQWDAQLKPFVNKTDPIIQYMTEQIQIFHKIWTSLRLCVGDTFEREHWRSLFILLKIPKEINLENLKFGHLLDAENQLFEKTNDLKELVARSQGEISLREAIQELKQWCDTYCFELTENISNNRTTPLIKEWKDLLTKVSDNQSLLLSMKESKFIGRFADQIDQFEQKLGGVDEYLTKLQIIQRKWVYLEPIFGRGALPAEQGRFRRLDDDFRSIMLNIEKDPRVVLLCQIGGIRDTLETILDQLERCQKALNDFLEEKRSRFPRFYFLGDDDLLEILGQSQNANVIQMHLKKLFAGIHKVEFDKKIEQILSMVSSQKESVVLCEKVQIQENVENWLSELSIKMVKTLKNSLNQCLGEDSLQIENFPSQILCVREEIMFNYQALEAIKEGKLDSLNQNLNKKLEFYTKQVGGSEHLTSLKLKALILDLIHQIEVINLLINEEVKDVQDWNWYKQLKYQMQEKICEITMCRAKFNYTYEYQGNAPKLVHTPLTDKCYLTLTQGMDMGYGGNPYGPAGTGKTESVKALGQAFGRQVLVFNCDEGLDFKSMGRIFIGLVKCGAWGCFDEFNRLLEEQLSAISQQIQIIQWAIKEDEKTMHLMSQIVEVNRNSGIFVTLNPAGKGYGGRSKLPDNLKQLFRPVAMSVPDNEIIAETLLYSEGFKNAKDLAQKVISVFTLSKQLLSPQQHYDWGLRALKTILTVAGQLIQREKNQKITKEVEYELVIKAIRINTMSKLTFQDTQKFVSLLEDVFPGTISGDILYEQISEVSKEVLRENRLDIIETQIQKILQFYEATKQRMGVVLVGPSGCGKTTIWKTLKKAYEKIGQQVKIYIMNPKSMPRSQLLGLMNNDTREFSEGVLTSSAREVVKNPADVINWIICDGDIDPEWIESLNSVLDDNHLLTLPTGERISFGDNVNFIFETNDLQFASPATVSRMGMIFLNQEDIKVQSVVLKWLSLGNNQNQDLLKEFLDQFFYKILDFVSEFEDEQIVNTTKIGLVNNVLSLLQNVQTKNQFFVQILKGFASNFPQQIRSKIAKFIFDLGNISAPVDINLFPLDFYITEDSQQLKAIKSHQQTENIQNEDFANNNEENPLPIKTIGLQSDIELIKPWILNCQPFIICGPEGCGKSMLIRSSFEILKNLNQKISIATIFCNAQTTAQQIIQKLNQICIKGTFAQGRILKPKEASRLVIYLKDINLPKPDKYLTIQLIAFLQQIITHKGYYDDSLEFIYLDEKIQIVCSMAPPSTIGRHQISTRFTANVRIHYMQYPKKEELCEIYECFFLKNNLKNNNMEKKMANTLIELYFGITKIFNVDQQRHYNFTPRNLTQIVFGMSKYENDQQIIESFLNEINKTFKDRLINIQQQNQFDEFVYNLLNQNFQVQKNSLKDIYFAYQNNKFTKLSKKDYIQYLQQGLMLYEREFKEMKLHLLDEILSLLSSLDRALSLGGGILLCGKSGIGRRSCLSLICAILRMEINSPCTMRDYSVRDFKKELKIILEKAAVQNKQMVLFIEDHHVQKSEFLEIINSLISCGEIPGLFSQEEIEHSFSNNIEDIRREYYGKSLYEIFCLRVKQNLRVVLNMDFTSKEFGNNCAQNPAFFAKCTVIWLSEWKQESMKVILMNELQEGLFKQVQNEKQQENIVNQIINIHDLEVKENQAAPLKFFQFVETYKKIFEGKINSRGSKSQHLKQGLKKLQEAKDMVDQLGKQAQQKQKELAQKQAEADTALVQISKAMQDAADRKQECEQIKHFLQSEEVKIQDSRIEVAEQLKDVQPLVEAAQKSVQGIQKGDLDFLRNLKMPPPVIHNIMRAVLRVFENNDDRWTEIKKFLGNRQVLEQIINFDPSIITPKVRREVQIAINENESSFRKEVSYNASKAVGPMAEWVLAILKYSEVIEKVLPLQQKLQKFDQKLNDSKQKLKENENELIKLEQKVESLKDNFSQKTSEAQKLKSDLKKEEETLNIASSLLSKLADEKIRWEHQSLQIETEFQTFPQNSLLAAAFTTYLPQKDENQREKALLKWKKSSNNSAFNYLKFLTTEQQILKWKQESLPSDSLTLENTLILQNTSKTALMIDPNGQATSWLKKTHSNLEILNFQDQKFSNQLELAVLFGKTLLIQEMDKIEPILVPILRKDLIHQGPRWVIQIGDKYINFSENFVLFLATRNSSIQIQQSIQAQICIINYSVTKSGLEGKLLSIIINHEQPDLENKKQELLENEQSLKIQLADLEKTLLEELANSQGNILENTVLLESLNQTKAKSQTITISLAESTKLQENLDTQREVYRTLAIKGAQLFITISDLSKINNMYRFSLQYFINLFSQCLNTPKKASEINQKLKESENQLNKIIFNNIASSLFKADRMTLSLHLINDIFPQFFAENEYQFFLGNILSIENQNTNFPKFLPQENREQFSSFISTFPQLNNQLNFTQNAKEWEKWSKTLECEKAFPQNINITPFQKVLVVQIFRPERLQTSLNDFICEILQLQSLSGNQFSFQSLNKDEPSLFILSPGSDPSTELEEYANQEIGRENYISMSMGGNQNDIALEKLREAQNKGLWICLKNLHLVTSWLPVLEKEIKNTLQNETTHKNYRVFLTTEPHEKFPAILLETCQKISYESPPGVKKGIERILNGWNNELLSKGNTKRAQLMFSASFFHSILVERRTFIPQGWSKIYEFSYGDLRAAIQIIENLHNDNNFSWKTLHGLFENAIYGGRIDEFFDMRVLRAYIDQYFNEKILNGTFLIGNLIKMPQSNNINDFQAIIEEKMPENDTPLLFGLPQNIDKAVQRYNTQRLIENLKKIKKTSLLELKFDKIQWLQNLEPIFLLWNTLNKNIKNLPQIKNQDLLTNDPIESFVFLEAQQSFLMLEKINQQINNLQKVLEGNALLTTEIHQTGNDLMLGNIPEKWLKIWEGAENPSQWLKGFTTRVSQLKKWLENTKNNTLVNNSVNLADLFHPDVFLNAVRQKSARLMKKPLNDLKIVCSFDNKKIQSLCPIVIKVSNLLLQGCNIEGEFLQDGGSDIPEFICLEELYFGFVEKKQGDIYDQKSLGEFPIFANIFREQLIAKVNLPIKGCFNKKVLAGVAIILQNN